MLLPVHATSETVTSTLLGINSDCLTEGRKVILKPDISTMSWVMSEKCSNKAGSARKSSIKKWKWFIQDGAAGGMQGGPHCLPEQIAYFPLGLSLEPPDELPEPFAAWDVCPRTAVC